MNDHPTTAAFPTLLTDDPLVYLQTLVARRADELRMAQGRATGHDLECWLQAEHDVFDGCWSPAALVAH